VQELPANNKIPARKILIFETLIFIFIG